MVVPVLRMVTTALLSPTYGVNVQLPLLNIDPSDTVPPAITGILSELTSIELAFDRIPKDQTFPALLVSLDGEFDITANDMNNYREAEIPVLVHHVTKNIDTAKAFSESYYTMQAALHCLSAFQLNQNAGDRERNNVQILGVTAIRHTKNFQNLDDAFVTTGLKLTFTVRDVFTT